MPETIHKQLDFEIVTKSARKNEVYGWAYVSSDRDGNQVIDASGDVIDVDVLEAAGHEFVTSFREANFNHDGKPAGELIEAITFTKAKQEALGIPPGHVAEGLWVGFKLSPEVFDSVAAGTHLAFSIEGEGQAGRIED